MIHIGKTHNTTNVYIPIDTTIQPIIKYIFEEYKYEIIPYSSCENNHNRARICCIIRNYNKFLNLIYELFQFDIKHYVTDMQYSPNLSRNTDIELSWNANNTHKIITNIKNIKMENNI